MIAIWSKRFIVLSLSIVSFLQQSNASSLASSLLSPVNKYFDDVHLNNVDVDLESNTISNVNVDDDNDNDIEKLERLLSSSGGISFSKYVPLTGGTDADSVGRLMNAAYIDLDQKEIERNLNRQSVVGFDNAKALYTFGAHSGSYAFLNLEKPLFSVIKKNTKIVGYNSLNRLVEGQVLQDAQINDNHISILYNNYNADNPMMKHYVNNDVCMIGVGMDPITDGCFVFVGNVSFLEQHKNKLLGAQLVTLDYYYDPIADNRNDWSIQKFSLEAEKLMFSCDGVRCPHDTYLKYHSYYGTHTYANDYIQKTFAAIKYTDLDMGGTNQNAHFENPASFGPPTHAPKNINTTTTNATAAPTVKKHAHSINEPFINGNVDFSKYSTESRSEILKKATVILNVWMFVVHQLEETVNQCLKAMDDITACKSGDHSVGVKHTDKPMDIKEAMKEYDSNQNDTNHCDNKYYDVDAIGYPWDLAVAYYTGSTVVTTDANHDGHLLYSLANLHCQQFKTCARGTNGEATTTGVSQVNDDILNFFILGKTSIQTKDCSALQFHKQDIIERMAVPLIQGLLQYAYTKTYVDETPLKKEKNDAVGVVYTSAVLPLIDYCDYSNGYKIYDRMIKRDAPETKEAGLQLFKEVKSALEANYECLNIKCDQVGGIFNQYSNQYLSGAEPCGEKSQIPPSNTNNNNYGGSNSGGSSNSGGLFGGHSSSNTLEDERKKEEAKINLVLAIVLSISLIAIAGLIVLLCCCCWKTPEPTSATPTLDVENVIT